MRHALVLIALAGCRGVFGIDEASVLPPPDDGVGFEGITPGDAPVDGVPMGCPASYNTLPNSGPRGHRYLQVNTPGSWTLQRDACVAAGGFLAFPDGADSFDATLELQALVQFGGGGLWIGVNDLVTEGMYRTTLNQPASGSTLSLFNPSGAQAQRDCWTGQAGGTQDDDCAMSRKAVCECVP